MAVVVPQDEPAWPDALSISSSSFGGGAGSAGGDGDGDGDGSMVLREGMINLDGTRLGRDVG